jgi:hypothetical protein
MGLSVCPSIFASVEGTCIHQQVFQSIWRSLSRLGDNRRFGKETKETHRKVHRVKENNEEYAEREHRTSRIKQTYTQREPVNKRSVSAVADTAGEKEKKMTKTMKRCNPRDTKNNALSVWKKP